MDISFTSTAAIILPERAGRRRRGSPAGAVSSVRIERKPVRSSSVAEIGYEPRRRILDVLFHNGGLYRYFGVPANVHSALICADSIGRYMNRFVRNRFPYVRRK